MTDTQTIKVPDIGDFDQVPIIEILVAEGDSIDVEQSLVTLESDKATLEVPSPVAGVVKKLLVAVGDEVSEGASLLEIEPADDDAIASDESDDKSEQGDDGADERSQAADQETGGQSGESADSVPKGKEDDSSASEAAAASSSEASEQTSDADADVLVLGSGPGGYTAAFRAADLGQRVVLVERYPTLGGVCLNVGCIPSKALLHTAKIIDEAAAMAEHGVSFGEPELDLDKLRDFEQGVVKKLTGGLAQMAKQRGVRVVQGEGRFAGSHSVVVAGESGEENISFEHAIIAAGSQPLKLSGFPWDDPRVMDSTDALELADIPERLLVVGGGIIGLEMGCVYAALGTKVTVVELMDQLMPGADKDLVRPLTKRLQQQFESIHLKTKVAKVEARESGLLASFEGEKAPDNAEFDRVLVAVGRTPNGKAIAADKAGVKVDDKGYIAVDDQMRTNVKHIFAIGDIVGQPMLAHKATHEGKVAAEVCAGQKAAFLDRVIPSVAYTDPEVAWVGLTETEAKASGTEVGKGVFPWAASGRALGQGRAEGMTKLLFDKASGRLVGAGIVGPHAGDLIAECGHAIEMGSDAEDLGLTIHPHPTLSETVAMAAEAYEGTITDLYLPKKK